MPTVYWVVAVLYIIIALHIKNNNTKTTKQTYPSSKTCNKCGYVNKGLKLSDREWVCPVCGKKIDRDYNAARNIRDEGLRKLVGSSTTELTLVDYPTMDDRHRDMVLKSSDRLKQEKNEFH